ncbi:hypothetical protein [Streptomyces sp. ME18-1-4]|uniref:hypothetical protein n=1 Tax=Streptomyces sp. ME18-1-4 TaxID=3028685 RepID=UPI0039F6F69E
MKVLAVEVRPRLPPLPPCQPPAAMMFWKLQVAPSSVLEYRASATSFRSPSLVGVQLEFAAFTIASAGTTTWSPTGFR